MITLDQFESGLRLDQYIAHIKNNKENFRANFIKATESIALEDLSFFRSLPKRIHIAVLTNDASPDALRDVPVVSRLSSEVSLFSLRLFDEDARVEAAGALRQATRDACAEGQLKLPVFAFFDEHMDCIGAQCGPLPELAEEMRRRHQAWVEEHPDVGDAMMPIEEMSAITRTRLTQAIYAMTPEQRAGWGRMLIGRCRQILATNQAPSLVA